MCEFCTNHFQQIYFIPVFWSSVHVMPYIYIEFDITREMTQGSSCACVVGAAAATVATFLSILNNYANLCVAASSREHQLEENRELFGKGGDNSRGLDGWAYPQCICILMHAHFYGIIFLVVGVMSFDATVPTWS